MGKGGDAAAATKRSGALKLAEKPQKYTWQEVKKHVSLRLCCCRWMSLSLVRIMQREFVLQLNFNCPSAINSSDPTTSATVHPFRSPPTMPG
eukprot:scaffold15436_cov221-Alexandrium_tamarense.AAC.1